MCEAIHVETGLICGVQGRHTWHFVRGPNGEDVDWENPDEPSSVHQAPTRRRTNHQEALAIARAARGDLRAHEAEEQQRDPTRVVVPPRGQHHGIPESLRVPTTPDQPMVGALQSDPMDTAAAAANGIGWPVVEKTLRDFP